MGRQSHGNRKLTMPGLRIVRAPFGKQGTVRLSEALVSATSGLGSAACGEQSCGVYLKSSYRAMESTSSSLAGFALAKISFYSSCVVCTTYSTAVRLVRGLRSIPGHDTKRSSLRLARTNMREETDCAIQPSIDNVNFPTATTGRPALRV